MYPISSNMVLYRDNGPPKIIRPVSGFTVEDIHNEIPSGIFIDWEFSDIDNKNHRFYYIDNFGMSHGSDAWLALLYYSSGFAKTIIFYSEEIYREFIAKFKPLCHQDYEDIQALSGYFTNRKREINQS